jgi:hypothetical protein
MQEAGSRIACPFLPIWRGARLGSSVGPGVFYQAPRDG